MSIGLVNSPELPANRHACNRVTALISSLVVLLEAGEKSGTRHLGWEAIRLGRPLLLARSLVEAGLTWPPQLLAYGAEVLDDISSVTRLLSESGEIKAKTGFPPSRE